jgi:ElaB/YqjD/DUF883 family membrane-anchored ribosome-binding protein
MAEADLKKEIDTLKADLEAVRGDLGRILEKAKETGGRRLRDGAAKAGDELGALRERLDALIEETGTRSEDGLRRIEGQIRERPLVSLAGAFAIGLALGKLLDRR